jgi:hypothetical protein
VTLVSNGTCTIAANQPGNANYAAAPQVAQAFQVAGGLFTLSVSKAGTGGGTVTSDVSGINCGATCASNFAFGAVVTLTAMPDAGSGFTGWSGACSGTGTCQVTMSTALSVTATFDTQDLPRLANISTRGQVQTGFDVMIGGFVISGSVSKTVVIRAIGPSLANFGVAGALANPQLQLVRQSDQVVIASNDDWGTAANAATLQASGFAPSNPLESAIYATLSPGAYTAIVSGVGNTSGVGLVEVYEVDHPEVELINISTRGKVLTGFDVMIGGFVILGNGPQTVVIRAIGPSLANFGWRARSRTRRSSSCASPTRRSSPPTTTGQRAERFPHPVERLRAVELVRIRDSHHAQPGRVHGDRVGRERRNRRGPRGGVRAVTKAGVAAVVINYNTAELTRRCTRALVDAGIAKVLLLDNASAAGDYERLRSEHAAEERVRLIRSETNLGFAAGSNALIAEALRDPACDRVLLVNSDAVVDPAASMPASRR